MKKKVAIVLSVILACSMSMTAMAAPSPSIQKEPVAQVVINPTVGTAGNNVAVQATTVNSEKSAVLPGTTFKTASGQVVGSCCSSNGGSTFYSRAGSGCSSISGCRTGFQQNAGS